MLTQYDIAILNTARLTLRRLVKAAQDDSLANEEEGWTGRHVSFNLGKFSETCDAAEDALFNVLNIANSHLKDEISNEQLHARPQDKDEEEIGGVTIEEAHEIFEGQAVSTA